MKARQLMIAHKAKEIADNSEIHATSQRGCLKEHTK